MKEYKQNLLNKIKKKSLNIGLVGIGYVGIKLVLAFSKNQNKVYCFDNDKEKIELLKNNTSPYSYIKSSEIKKKNKYLNLENKVSNINKCDVIIVCLPTPLKKEKPDLSHIKSGWIKFKPFLKKGQILILESTTYPGCTEDIFYKYLNNKFQIDKNFFLGYSPERENPGDKEYDFQNTPKVVSGIGKNSLEICDLLYQLIVKKTKIAESIRIAEASKLFENIYRSINIALINELKIACEHLNLNTYSIIDIAGTKPFGYSKFFPGPGIGGHCIPIDPLYFSWISKKKGFEVKFIELSARINKFRTNWIISEIKKIIKNQNKKKQKILLMGMAYKKNIEDTRESASVKIFKGLLNNNTCQVNYCDPFVKKISINKKIIKTLEYKKINYKKFDLIVIATDHDKFDYKDMLKSNKMIVDLRGRFHSLHNKKNIILL
jgi:UDP-N-acetyl-D-glucosamine dehydrogenase